MALDLIEGFSGKWRPEKYKDTYTAALQKVIQAKAGRQGDPPRARARAGGAARSVRGAARRAWRQLQAAASRRSAPAHARNGNGEVDGAHAQAARRAGEEARHRRPLEDDEGAAGEGGREGRVAGDRRADCARMDPAAFVLSQLPPPPARVLEVGCGAGELALALDAAGYDVVAVDPRAPDGPIFRRTTLARARRRRPVRGRGRAVLAAPHRRRSTLRSTTSRRCCVRAREARGRGVRLGPRRRPDGRLDRASSWARLGGAALAEWRAERERPARLRRPAARRSTGASRSACSSGVRSLHRSLERPELEAREREAIEPRRDPAIGFRYVGVRRG